MSMQALGKVAWQCEGMGRRWLEEAQIAAARPVLSEREVEVLLVWFATDSKGAAGRELFITPTTVATHISRVRAKYAAVGRQASSKTALFARMLEDGHTALDDW